MFNRRDLIRQGVALVSMGASVPRIFRQGIALAEAENSDMPERTLVVIQLAGGNDGLNMVIPYGDDNYHTLRPSLGIAPDKVLRLDDTFGLHPAMTGLKTMYDAGQVAVVNGVGYPNPNYSHFRAMEIWQSADPIGVPGEGWVGRYLDTRETEHNALLGLNIGGSTPAEFRSAGSPIPSLNRIEDYTLRQGSDPGQVNATRNTSVLCSVSCPMRSVRSTRILHSTIAIKIRSR
jgi:uncharacterized protein (DUF1501 family)